MSRSKKNKKSPQPALSFASWWRDWYESKSPILLFAVKFGLLLFVFYTLVSLPFFDRAFYSYLQANAWLANAILRLFGTNSQVSDVTIHTPQFAIAIRRGCDAVEPSWLLCAAILSFPAPIRSKLVGMMVGILVLQVLNLARIVTLFWIGIKLPAFFNSAHLEVWPTVFIIVAITLFVSWKVWATEPVKPHAPA